uniref:N-acetylneuraminate lyase n=1 Tax=Amphimedon queenslandica TaxID=400682 RepID=A0A1X7UK19_AMPQE
MDFMTMERRVFPCHGFCDNGTNGFFACHRFWDNQLLASLAMGGSSAIGTTYNYCGLLNNRLLKYFKEGDLKSALREQRRSDDAIMILRKYASIAGVVGAAKAILKARGFDVGPPRLPLLPLSVEDYGSLVTDLKSIGFFDWA